MANTPFDQPAPATAGQRPPFRPNSAPVALRTPGSPEVLLIAPDGDLHFVLCHCLRHDFPQVHVTEARGGPEFRNALPRLPRIDLALVAPVLPEGSALEVVSTLYRDRSEARVLVFRGLREDYRAFASVVREGSNVWLSEFTDPWLLIEALRAAIANALSKPEALALTANNLLLPELAVHLGVRRSTAATYLKRILRNRP